jgi:hypothetical protein
MKGALIDMTSSVKDNGTPPEVLRPDRFFGIPDEP